MRRMDEEDAGGLARHLQPAGGQGPTRAGQAGERVEAEGYPADDAGRMGAARRAGQAGQAQADQHPDSLRRPSNAREAPAVGPADMLGSMDDLEPFDLAAIKRRAEV